MAIPNGKEYVRVKSKITAALVSTISLVSWNVSAEAHVSFRHHHRMHGSALSGLASWYGPGFQGHRTASGERYNTNGLTAAHRSLPMGCRVLVTNQANGRSVVVRINDRGPFGGGRVIDLSRASARAIGMSGTAPVSLSRL